MAILPFRPGLRAAGEKFLRIGTGPTGGSYFPVGAMIANILSSPLGATECGRGGSCGVPGVIVAAGASQGSVANLNDLMSQTVDLGISQADVVREALAGADGFAGKPVGQLRAIASLFTEALHIVVHADSGLASLADLRGKRVSLGEQASGTFATAQMVLQADKVPSRTLTVSHDPLNRAASLLAQRKIDAFFMVGGYPLEAIVRLAESMPIALVSPGEQTIASLTGPASSLRSVQIPAGIYDGVGAVATLGPRALLLTTAAMDSDLVYNITRALWDDRNRRLFDSGPPLAQTIRRTQALDGLTAPLHPGALRFYSETGMTATDNH